MARLPYVDATSTGVTVGRQLQGHPSLILRHTAPGDLVFDQMAGSGTTLVEYRIPGRRAVGVDINPDAVMVVRNRLDFAYAPPIERDI